MEKEVDDIIHECHRSNFVELPHSAEQQLSTTTQGQYNICNSDIEDELVVTDEEYTSQDEENDIQVIIRNRQMLLLYLFQSDKEEINSQK